MLHINVHYLHVKVCLSQLLFTKREKLMIYTIWMLTTTQPQHPSKRFATVGVVVRGNSGYNGVVVYHTLTMAPIQ